MNEDEAIQNITKKIERERALLNAANAMRSQTNNEAVRSRLDSQIRDGRRNIQFFEEKLRDIQMRKVGQGVEGMSLGGDDGGAPPAPPPKDASSSFGGQGYGSMSRDGPPSDLQPPNPTFGAPGPGAASKTRPTFTKLGMSTMMKPTASLLAPPWLGVLLIWIFPSCLQDSKLLLT